MSKLLNLRQLDGEIVRGEEEEETEGDKGAATELASANDPAPLGDFINTLQYNTHSFTCIIFVVLEAITLKIHERTQLRLQEVCVCVLVCACVYTYVHIWVQC